MKSQLLTGCVSVFHDQNAMYQVLSITIELNEVLTISASLNPNPKLLVVMDTIGHGLRSTQCTKDTCNFYSLDISYALTSHFIGFTLLALGTNKVLRSPLFQFTVEIIFCKM